MTLTENAASSSAAAPRVRKFPCAACGADLVFDPSAASLKCPYCGAEKAIPKSAEAVRESPIAEALNARYETGWGTERKSVRCTKCGATTTFPPGATAGACAFCGTPAVVEAPPNANLLRPRGLLAFRVERNAAVARFRAWISNLWFRPSDLSTKSSLANLAGVYVPFFTFDAATSSAWSADAGYYYTVDVPTTENGQTVMRREQRVRWEPASGFLEKLFDDVAVEASAGLPRDLAESIEPFPTADLVPYEPSYLSGFLAEEYAVPVKEALGIAEARMRADIEAACAAAVPGDTHRNLEVKTAFSGIAYKTALLPVWIAAYQYGGKPFRFLVNGVTGRVAGKAPYSWIKIGLAVLAALFILILFASLSHR